tara:strand:- start:143 stop:397 length:255 start_codon:yes stop_codon:yes gene_type:complete
MKYKNPLIFLVLLISTLSFAQVQNNQQKGVYKVEEFILTKKLDSALILLKDLKTSDRVVRLKKIASKKPLSYADYFVLEQKTVC